jgi:hypothetical protein
VPCEPEIIVGGKVDQVPRSHLRPSARARPYGAQMPAPRPETCEESRETVIKLRHGGFSSRRHSPATGEPCQRAPSATNKGKSCNRWTFG